MAARNPSTWDEYERGSSPQRSGSFSSSPGQTPGDEEQSLLGNGEDNDSPGLRYRRPSVSNRLAALTEIGGVNSIRSFTRSWQRAAGFAEVLPQRPSFVFAPDQAPLAPGSSSEAIQYGRSDIVSTPHPKASLLRQHLEADSPSDPSQITPTGPSYLSHGEPGASDAAPVDFRERERKALDDELAEAFFPASSSVQKQSVFDTAPHLTSPLIGSYSTFRSYGSMQSGISRASMLDAGTFWQQQQQAAVGLPDAEIQPILVKEVEQDGKIVLTVDGQSTLPQTIFNSINVLIGVGLLSLPMGIKYAGWLCGMVTLLLCALVTSYTARLLTKCMDLDVSLITFSDLAYISFGSRARVMTSILFTLELVAACVALVVLFADSLNLLFPGFLTVTQWKIVCSLLMMPLNFLPLRLLSFTSIIGILSCFMIVVIVVMDGLLKPHGPGSLIEPATTYLFPANWLTLPLSFGLLMSPWGGHSVFPNIYRDMRHPYKYGRAIKVTFTFTYLLDAVTAVAGLLMFGDEVRDEITSNILKTSGYPRLLNFLICTFIAIVPLTKIPLNARPIVTTLEVLGGVHQPITSENQDAVSSSPYVRGAIKGAVRILVVLVLLVISILFPAFDSIMAFMGSALCFTICVILPVAFYLRLFTSEISTRERIFCYILITVSTIVSVVGTIWAFLPKSLIHAE